jgi:hypothetical protein
MFTIDGLEMLDDEFAISLACNFTVTTAGNNACEAGRRVQVTGINMFAEDGSLIINVEHNSTCDVYGDAGFVNAISKVLKKKVMFTEEGMQDDGLASMELDN